MSKIDCEKLRKFISPGIYKLPLITNKDPPTITEEKDCTEFYEERGDAFKNLNMCKTHITNARTKYKNVTGEMAKARCPLSGGMRKRRKSRRTKRKRKSLKKTR